MTHLFLAGWIWSLTWCPIGGESCVVFSQDVDAILPYETYFACRLEANSRWRFAKAILEEGGVDTSTGIAMAECVPSDGQSEVPMG